MNACLQAAFDKAKAALSQADQEELADFIAAYTANHSAVPMLTKAELAEMKRRFDEPFVAAPAEDIEAFFKKALG